MANNPINPDIIINFISLTSDQQWAKMHMIEDRADAYRKDGDTQAADRADYMAYVLHQYAN